MPLSAELWALPVRFEHLWKIRSPLHSVEGFDMQGLNSIEFQLDFSSACLIVYSETVQSNRPLTATVLTIPKPFIYL